VRNRSDDPSRPWPAEENAEGLWPCRARQLRFFSGSSSSSFGVRECAG
jgi:hypothetical protein